MMDSLPVKMIRMTSLDIDLCTVDCSRLKCCQCTGLDIKLLYIGRFYAILLSEYHSRGMNLHLASARHVEWNLDVLLLVYRDQTLIQNCLSTFCDTLQEGRRGYDNEIRIKEYHLK